MLSLVHAAITTPAPPIAYMADGGAVDARAKSGAMVNVTRSYLITYATPITITRALIDGECTKKCRVFEMPDAPVINLQPGLYHQTRVLKLPDGMPPGKYKLVFFATWQGWFGREYQVKAPELQIEIE